MHRRSFLRFSASALALSCIPRQVFSFERHGASASELPSFSSDSPVFSKTYQAALDCLAGNTQRLSAFPNPVLLEGSVYRGVWLECAPQEGLAYGFFRPEVALANHEIFFALQRQDGYLPCNVKPDARGAGQIQMVVPIAATALETAQRTGHSKLLESAYNACSRWDDWLMRYRNTRGTGLCEGFCTYDTGHDNSPRWKGIPNRCDDADARNCPKAPGLPRLCPDLSATVYGGRVALARIARELNRRSEADRWEERAESIRALIVDRLYDPKDAAFYDLDSQNRFVRVRGDVITRVLGEHVVDEAMFNHIWDKQIHNPKAFWSPYPLPSIASDDPAFVRPIPRNSWGGASQALTALRAPRWMEHYGRPADLAYMMTKWVDALIKAGEFRQQLDPLTGEFTTEDPGGYSPAALVFLEYAWRLCGVRRESDTLEWNCRIPAGSRQTSFSIATPRGTAMLRHSNDVSELSIGGRHAMTVRGTARVVTDLRGNVRKVVGTSQQKEILHLVWAGRTPTGVTVRPNQSIAWTGS